MSASDVQANILIVDDRPDKLLALEAVLSDMGENIVCASSGRDALRHVLATEFAVILLDVNMPGMDGFETAELIRRRKSSEHVPIIFITAMGDDEMHAVRGYSLGAVDYILAPVVPEVLRSKVAVFVELFHKSQQVRLQAESLRRRAGQLQKLAQASIVINSALSLDRMLQAVTATAGEVLGAHQAITFFLDPRPGTPNQTQACTAFSDRYDEWRDRTLRLEPLAESQVLKSHSATRLSEAEVLVHPDWDIVRNLNVPPVRGGMLAAPLTGRDGNRLGVIYVADPVAGQFSVDDEVIAVQLAQMTSIAIENALFAQEREANRLKEEFLSTLSHELRTPLNAILGWTQILRMGDGITEVAHGVEVIERNARAQVRLIEDLLDISRISTGKFRLNIQPVSLEPLVRETCESHRPAAAAKNVDFSIDVADEPMSLNADPDRLRQVLNNLLTNAMKFTPAGGRIHVSATTSGGTARIAVADTGAGIDPAFLPHVFDRFRQADASSTRRQGGLGIGLAIVRHIIQLHGGQVRADSDGAGKGSTFSVMLPLARDPSDSTSRQPARHDANGASGHADATLDGLKVLLLDDHADAREMLKRMLQRAHADVSTAGSAAEALSLVPLVRPDIILSDIAMPEEDGYSFVRKLRAMPEERGGQTTAIALTAYARDQDRAAAAAGGFQEHLAKPVSSDVVIATILRHCRGESAESAIPEDAAPVAIEER